MSFSEMYLDAAHSDSFQNRPEVEASEVCGCFYCCTAFSGKDVTYWITDDRGDTAVCPRCPADAVVGSASGLPVADPAFLTAMHDRWFKRTVHVENGKPPRDRRPQGIRPMSIAVRPATSADAPELAELLNAIIARGGTTALEEAFTPERLDETYLTGSDVLSCVVAVDTDSGRLEGFQTLIREPHLPEDWGDIATFSRVDGIQRGVGSALFAATRERARALGLAAVNAEIRADNTGGLAFYSKMGFQDYHVDRAVPLSDGTPVDRINKRYMLNATIG